MSAEQRLERLYPALTAKERGLLVLRAYKAGQRPDPEIYHRTPSIQGPAFNRYIRLMNAVNVELATVLQILQVQVEKLDLRHAWFLTVHRWSIETSVIGQYLDVALKEAITASEYALDRRQLVRQFTGLHQLGRGQHRRNQETPAGDGVLQPEPVEDDDLDHALKLSDARHAVEIVGASHRALAAPP